MGYSVGPAQMSNGMAPNAFMMGASRPAIDIDPRDYLGGKNDPEYIAAMKKAMAEEDLAFKDVGTSPRPMMPGGYQIKPTSMISSGY